MNGQTDKTPLHVKIVGTDAGPGKVLFIGLLSLVPVAVAILMQNPALRQQLAMRFWHDAEAAAAKTGKAFDGMARKAHLKYELVRM